MEAERQAGTFPDVHEASWAIGRPGSLAAQAAAGVSHDPRRRYRVCIRRIQRPAAMTRHPVTLPLLAAIMVAVIVLPMDLILAAAAVWIVANFPDVVVQGQIERGLTNE